MRRQVLIMFAILAIATAAVFSLSADSAESLAPKSEIQLMMDENRDQHKTMIELIKRLHNVEKGVK